MKYIIRCRTLLNNLSEEEVKAILKKNIGSKNMSSLARMIKFLELERGRNTSEKFVRNLVLLSILYASSQDGKALPFADLVFQALYVTLSSSGSKKPKHKAPRRIIDLF